VPDFQKIYLFFEKTKKMKRLGALFQASQGMIAAK
jgi:hypothetical protein